MLSKKIFISADVFIAFINRRDAKHLQAAALFRLFAQDKYQLYTSVLNINSAYEKIFDIISPSVGKDFLRGLYQSNINILYPDENDYRNSVKTLIDYGSYDLKFSDSLMSVLAKRFGITQICTFEFLHQIYGIKPFYLPI